MSIQVSHVTSPIARRIAIRPDGWPEECPAEAVSALLLHASAEQSSGPSRHLRASARRLAPVGFITRRANTRTFVRSARRHSFLSRAQHGSAPDLAMLSRSRLASRSGRRLTHPKGCTPRALMRTGSMGSRADLWCRAPRLSRSVQWKYSSETGGCARYAQRRLIVRWSGPTATV
jgi:hypothetical protein